VAYKIRTVSGDTSVAVVFEDLQGKEVGRVSLVAAFRGEVGVYVQHCAVEVVDRSALVTFFDEGYIVKQEENHLGENTHGVSGTI